MLALIRLDESFRLNTVNAKESELCLQYMLLTVASRQHDVITLPHMM